VAEVNEEIARVFFELCGFLVRTNVKYQVKGKKRGVSGTSDLDLVVYNPNPKNGRTPGFRLSVEDMPYIRQAIVEVKGWHQGALTPYNITKDEGGKRVFLFTRDEALSKAKETLERGCIRKILVISRLGPRTRDKTEKLLAKGKIDHILEFDTMLGHIVKKTGASEHHSESEVLQTVRLLKNYDLLKDTAGESDDGK